MGLIFSCIRYEIMGRKIEIMDPVSTNVRLTREEWCFCKDNNLSFTSVLRNGVRDMMAGGSVLKKTELEEIRFNLVKRMSAMHEIIESILNEEEYAQFLRKVEEKTRK